MAGKSSIEWTDSTVNFWWGCTKVGPGCDHCYAEKWSRRTGGEHWGVGVPRRKIKSAVALIHRLDNDYSEWAADYYAHEGNARAFGLPAPTYGPRRRVFIQSMSDLFDLEVPADWFAEAWGKIEVCNRIDIQIVTKRLSAVTKRLSEIGCIRWPGHAGLIATVVNQEEVDRELPRLVGLKLRLGIPWIGLSVEPMLGRVDITPWLRDLDWVICGGESGKDARPMHPQWARDLRDQCKAAGVPFFFKQWGSHAPASIVLPGDHLPEDADHMLPSSKKAAGRHLDGIEHNAMPGRPA
jgi:protein gp37